uniref:Uncharacterized protein n=1 Tax=Oryza sativa subsp. japonica TaxID=39947 RepID=H2KX35_ORYSJ|nr:hypothetical protein LOC_Os12g37669 [Oryza sativa Japonica Group]
MAAASAAPFQVSISTSRSTTAADVPTRRSAASPSRGFVATVPGALRGGADLDSEQLAPGWVATTQVFLAPLAHHCVAPAPPTIAGRASTCRLILAGVCE